MGMKPEDFFASFVEGNAWEYEEHPECIRRAFNAAISASHMADHYYNYNKRHNPNLVSSFSELGDYVEYLSNKTGGAFRDIRSIANAYKHLYTDSSKGASAYATLNSSGAVDHIELPGDPQLSEMEGGYVEGNDPQAGTFEIVFTRKDGTRGKFRPVLEETLDYWRAVIRDRA